MSIKHFILLACVVYSTGIAAQNFDDFFLDKTLRIDYIFSGDKSKQAVYVDELSEFSGWYGRRHNLSEIPLAGNGQIVMRDAQSGQCIYKTSFSSLFQEWLSTDEAATTGKAFENTFLVPYPRKKAEVEITLFNFEQGVIAGAVHAVDPGDILIRRKGISHAPRYRYIHTGEGDSKCINIAILAEGYTEDEMDIFRKDALIAYESIFSHEPFRSMKDKFNVIAVESPSKDSGVSVPRKKIWKDMAFDSHFDTFYTNRYLTTSRTKKIHDVLTGIPYEHIIILVNTEEYGGGGIYNSFTLTTAHHPMFRPVVVHEFGHSFGGLADEYFYDNDVISDIYPHDVEPWEQNITTLVDFKSKWEDMLAKETPIPTPPAERDKYPVGVYEGGGYSIKGIYRPADDCRMRTNAYPVFCPVCQRSIQRVIDFYTK